MNEQLFNIVLLLIPVIGALITGIFIPYLKTRITSTQFDQITKWVTKAVEAAEVMFDVPDSGEQKSTSSIKCSMEKKKLLQKTKYVFCWSLPGNK